MTLKEVEIILGKPWLDWNEDDEKEFVSVLEVWQLCAEGDVPRKLLQLANKHYTLLSNMGRGELQKTNNHLKGR